METLILKGVITATSDKQSEVYRVETEQKSAYLKLDETETAKAKAFGLTEYGTDEKYFVVKLSQDVTIRFKDHVGNETTKTRSGLANETPNFHTDDKLCAVAIMKNQSKAGNEFFRLYSIFGKIVDVEKRDAFEEMDLTDIINDLPF